MEIKPVHIATKRVVGHVKGHSVVELVTTGGLSLLVMNKNGSMEVLGSGPHPAISKFVAEQREPDIQWTELSKSEGYPKPILEAISVESFELTKQLQEAVNKLGK